MSRVCDLMAEKRPQSGHNVSHSKRRTTRKFNPNLQFFTLGSDVFKRKFKMRLAASTMRTVDKHCGLDGFLRKVKTARLTDFAKKLKKQLFVIEGVPSAKKAEEKVAEGKAAKKAEGRAKTNSSKVDAKPEAKSGDDSKISKKASEDLSKSKEDSTS